MQWHQSLPVKEQERETKGEINILSNAPCHKSESSYCMRYLATQKWSLASLVFTHGLSLFAQSCRCFIEIQPRVALNDRCVSLSSALCVLTGREVGHRAAGTWPCRGHWSLLLYINKYIYIYIYIYIVMILIIFFFLKTTQFLKTNAELQLHILLESWSMSMLIVFLI